MPAKSIDLASIFQTVARELEQSQQSLNEMDSYNHDHGTNMAQTFNTISNALAKKKGASASTQLAYASKVLSKTATSSSGKLYAENLKQAAAQFKGKPVTEKGALDLLSTLIGSEPGIPQQTQPPQQPASSGDLLGALLGGIGGQAPQQPAQQAPATEGGLLGALLGGMGEQTPQQPTQQTPSAGGGLLGALLGGQATQQAPQQAPSAGGDLLGALLGGLSGGGTSGAQQGGGFDLGDLLQAGMAYMQAKQQGQGNLMAIIQAISATSRMGSSAPHRNQSTQLVVGSFLQALGGMKQ